jgi:hypothetical protein
VEKTEDFLIELLSIRECVGKSENCMRRIVDFSALVVTQVDTTFTLMGKMDLEDSTKSSSRNQVFLKIVIAFDDKRDQVSVSITLNKADKFQWIPASGNKIRFTFKIRGREDVQLVKTIPNGKIDTTFVFSTWHNNVGLLNEKQERVMINVNTNLTLSFPAKANGQKVKILTDTAKQPGDVFLDLEFYPQSFNAGILTYGTVLGSIQFFNLPDGATPARGDSSSSDSAFHWAVEDSSEISASSGSSVAHWMGML